MENPTKMNVAKPFLIMVLFGLAAFYAINAFNTGNWGWFLSSTDEIRPSQIVIIDNGQRTIYMPGHANYNALADAINQSLSKLNNTELVGIGLSDDTLADYNSRSLVMELYFEEPVIFNSMARTGEPTQLLIPLEGRHTGGGYVFLGGNGEWWYGAVRMADPMPLFAALERLGFVVSVNQPAG